jgi:hypothetical protein
MSVWPPLTTTSNYLRQSYVSGFLDVSGNALVRGDLTLTQPYKLNYTTLPTIVAGQIGQTLTGINNSTSTSTGTINYTLSNIPIGIWLVSVALQASFPAAGYPFASATYVTLQDSTNTVALGQYPFNLLSPTASGQYKAYGTYVLNNTSVITLQLILLNGTSVSTGTISTTTQNSLLAATRIA